MDNRKSERYFIGYNLSDVYDFMAITQDTFEEINDDRLKLFDKFSSELYNVKD